LTLLVSMFVLPFVWVTPTPHDLALSTGAGLTAGAAFLLLTTAFRSAPAALVASYQYSQMIYGLAVGWLLFGDLPTARMLLGASIIIAGGLYVLRHETRAGRATRVA
jgi:drug/metabolite transporter (DMT)-like permease